MSERPHDHAPITGGDGLGPYQLLAEAVRELLTEKGILSQDEIDARIAAIKARAEAAE